MESIGIRELEQNGDAKTIPVSGDETAKNIRDLHDVFTKEGGLDDKHPQSEDGSIFVEMTTFTVLSSVFILQ